MSRFKVGAQLIIWGKRILKDLPGVLDEVKSIGYDGIETSALLITRYPNMRELLSSRKLQLVAFHMGIGNLDIVRQALKVLNELGGLYLTFSGAGGKENTEENYRKGAQFLNEIGKLAKEYNIVVCYHNHAQEIINDAFGIKIIVRETDPELVKLCVDTYWVKCGGQDPVGFMEEYLDRIAYLHLKDGTEEDMRRRRFRELGEGVIDFPAIIRLAEKAGIQWLIVEQDRTERTPKESMEISRRYLRERLGI